MGDEVTCEDLGDTFPSVEDFNKEPTIYDVCTEVNGNFVKVSKGVGPRLGEFCSSCLPHLAQIA